MALAEPLSWQQLEEQCDPCSEAELQQRRVEGPTNAQARLRLFGRPESEVRVTLYRDHHAWCPYCQKVWLWLEEKRIPYRVRKVTMFCYGEKERWFKQIVPSGMLPALELDGHLITESDLILQALEEAFGPLGEGMQDPDVFALRQLAQCEYIGILHPLAEGTKRLLKCLQDQIAFGDQMTVQLKGRQHPGGDDLLEPALLLAVAEHRHLADPVGDPLLLQPQPHLLAVGAPGVVIAVEGDAHLGFRPTKQAQAGLRIGGAFHPPLLQLSLTAGIALLLELLPAQGLSQGHRWCGRVHGNSIAQTSPAPREH